MLSHSLEERQDIALTKVGVVVLTKAGEVVTAYSAKYFDDTMKTIIKMFY